MVERTSSLDLITGVPAIGKSTIGKELMLRGYNVRDNDHSSFQTWGKLAQFKRDASVFWMLRHPPRWDEEAIPLLRTEGKKTAVTGWYPGIFPTMKHFDNVYYLSPRFDFDLLIKRIRERNDKTFGSTNGQIVTSLIASMATEIGMRVIAVFKKNLRIVDAHLPAKQTASIISAKHFS